MQGELVGEGWRSGPLQRPVNFWQRWRGLRTDPPHGLWIATSTVHTFGMRANLWICALRWMAVSRVRLTPPGRLVWFREADSILELPSDRPPPALGLVLSWQDAGSADSVRDADRQPR